MKEHDCLKLLFISLGFTRVLEIEYSFNDYGNIIYNIHAEDNKGNVYDAKDRANTMKNIYDLLEFAQENNIGPAKVFDDIPIKELLSKDGVKRCNNLCSHIITTERQREAVKFCERVLNITFNGDPLNDYRKVSKFLSQHLNSAKEYAAYKRDEEEYWIYES